VSVLQAEFFIVSANITAVALIRLLRQVCSSADPGFLYSKIFVSVLQAEFFIVSANTIAVAQIILLRQVCFSANPGFLYSKIFVTDIVLRDLIRYTSCDAEPLGSCLFPVNVA